MERKVVVVLVVGDEHIETWNVPFREGTPFLDWVRLREVAQAVSDRERERLDAIKPEIVKTYEALRDATKGGK